MANTDRIEEILANIEECISSIRKELNPMKETPNVVTPSSIDNLENNPIQTHA
jgi:hypothetical protein